MREVRSASGLKGLHPAPTAPPALPLSLSWSETLLRSVSWADAPLEEATTTGPHLALSRSSSVEPIVLVADSVTAATPTAAISEEERRYATIPEQLRDECITEHLDAPKLQAYLAYYGRKVSPRTARHKFHKLTFTRGRADITEIRACRHAKGWRGWRMLNLTRSLASSLAREPLEAMGMRPTHKNLALLRGPLPPPSSYVVWRSFVHDYIEHEEYSAEALASVQPQYRFRILVGVLRVVETGVVASDDRECSGEPRTARVG